MNKAEQAAKLEDARALLAHIANDVDYVRSFPQTAREWLHSTESTIARLARLIDGMIAVAAVAAEADEREIEDYYAAECDEKNGGCW